MIFPEDILDDNPIDSDFEPQPGFDDFEEEDNFDEFNDDPVEFNWVW